MSSNITRIEGHDVVFHSRYKGCDIYKAVEGHEWYAVYLNDSGMCMTGNGSLADLKIDISYLVNQGKVIR